MSHTHIDSAQPLVRNMITRWTHPSSHPHYREGQRDMGKGRVVDMRALALLACWPASVKESKQNIIRTTHTYGSSNRLPSFSWGPDDA